MNALELVNDVLRTTGLGVGQQTLLGLDAESDAAKVLNFVNLSRLDLSRKVPQKPLQKTGSITTIADVTFTGVIATNGVSTISVVDAINSESKGRLIRIGTDQQIYRIFEVTQSGATFLIKLADLSGAECLYGGPTSSDTTAIVAQNLYALPLDFKAPISIQDFFGPGKMVFLSPTEFDRNRFEGEFTGWRVGQPAAFTIHGMQMDSSTVRHIIELWPIPDERQNLPFRYESTSPNLVADTDHSGYPPEFEIGILARARWYVYRFLKVDAAQAQIEEMTWREIVTDNQKISTTAIEAAQFIPVTNRDHWETAYDG